MQQSARNRLLYLILFFVIGILSVILCTNRHNDKKTITSLQKKIDEIEKRNELLYSANKVLLDKNAELNVLSDSMAKVVSEYSQRYNNSLQRIKQLKYDISKINEVSAYNDVKSDSFYLNVVIPDLKRRFGDKIQDKDE